MDYDNKDINILESKRGTHINPWKSFYNLKQSPNISLVQVPMVVLSWKIALLGGVGSCVSGHMKGSQIGGLYEWIA